MQEIKNKIEAVLFITGRFMDVEEIASFTNIASRGSVKQAMKSLEEDYSKRDGSLEIIKEEDKFKLNIKKAYNHLSTRLVSSAELDGPTQATLAIIAYKQPALQSEIIKMRGNTAYDHIKSLKDLEFLTSERKGRTRLLKLAPRFYDYFDVVQETLESSFKKVADNQEAKLTGKTKPKEEKQTEVVPEEKVEEPEVVELEPVKKGKVVVKVRDSKEKPEEVEEEIDRTPAEVLVNLDADDFGS